MTKSHRNKATSLNPFTASWQELARTVPSRDWQGFKELVLRADIRGELGPAWVVKKYPDHPLVLNVKRFLETGHRRAINKALKAVAGTDKNYQLLLMKS